MARPAVPLTVEQPHVIVTLRHRCVARAVAGFSAPASPACLLSPFLPFPPAVFALGSSRHFILFLFPHILHHLRVRAAGGCGGVGNSLRMSLHCTPLVDVARRPRRCTTGGVAHGVGLFLCMSLACTDGRECAAWARVFAVQRYIRTLAFPSRRRRRRSARCRCSCARDA